MGSLRTCYDHEYFTELSRGKQHVLIEDKQKQSYSKNLAQQDSVISVGQILDSTANKCLFDQAQYMYG